MDTSQSSTRSRIIMRREDWSLILQFALLILFFMLSFQLTIKHSTEHNSHPLTNGALDSLTVNPLLNWCWTGDLLLCIWHYLWHLTSGEANKYLDCSTNDATTTSNSCDLERLPVPKFGGSLVQYCLTSKERDGEFKYSPLLHFLAPSKVYGWLRGSDCWEVRPSWSPIT